MRRSDDIELAISAKFLDELVDQVRIDQRLITLNVDYVREPLCLFCDFGNAISPAVVPRRSQRDFGAPIKSGFSNAHIIGRDDRSEEHTFELQSPVHLVCRLLLEKKKNTQVALCQSEEHKQESDRSAPDIRD